MPSKKLTLNIGQLGPQASFCEDFSFTARSQFREPAWGQEHVDAQ